MTHDDRGVWLGGVTVSPEGAIQAGSYAAWDLTYTVGRYGIDSGGRLRLLFRYAWDGGVWQTHDPQADNFVTVRSSRLASSFRVSWDPRGGRRPWMRALIVEVADEPLAEGDRVVITLGDRSGGSRGHRAQTFVQSDFQWLLDIEAFESGTWHEVPGCPVYPVVAGPACQIALIAPSEAVAGEEIAFALKHMDAFGNPAPCSDAVVLDAQDYESGQAIAIGGLAGRNPLVTTAGLAEVVLSLAGSELARVRAVDAAQRATWSNPIRLLAAAPPLRHYWGDLHAQYSNALGTGSVREAMRYARDAAGISFTGHQPNDFQFSTPDWVEARDAIRAWHEPGRFVPFVGYEWSGNTPAGGDRNVHFLGDDGPLHRSSHWHVADTSDAAADRYPLSALYQEFAGRDDVLMVPHVGGRRCDITRHYDPRLEPVIEICSCHGRFEWLLREALANGYVVGVIGGSDDHTGRPGAAFATDHSFGTRGGLAGLFAPELTREAIFAALRARHCYATTGERIGLRVETADGHMMGDAYRSASPPRIVATIAGTAPLESVQIWRGLELACDFGVMPPPARNRIRLEWSGARVKGRGRHANWTGGARVEGGRILSAMPIAFDHPRQGVTAWDERSVRWQSTTSGDHDAVEIEIDSVETATVVVETPLAAFRFAATDLDAGPIVRDCGGVDLRFVARLASPVPAPRTIRLDWIDPAPRQGRNAYWFRITQADGEMAWSSPLYVDLP
jgi:hypothetical protein